MNYHHHIKFCHSLVERYEAEAKLRYDVVMFARSDLQWAASLPQHVIRAAAASRTTTLQHDVFMVAPRTVAKDLATILHGYFTFTCDFRDDIADILENDIYILPEAIVENAATASGKKHNVGVDYTWKY